MSQSLIEEARKRSDQILNSNPSDPTILKQMNEMDKVLGNGYCYINILKSVYPDKEIRDASSDAVAELNKLAIELK